MNDWHHEQRNKLINVMFMIKAFLINTFHPYCFHFGSMWCFLFIIAALHLSSAAGRENVLFQQLTTSKHDSTLSGQNTEQQSDSKSIHVGSPSRLPVGEVGETIIFPVPGSDERVRCVVEKSVLHDGHNSISVFGSVGGDPMLGSFSLACHDPGAGADASADSSLVCVGNIRPISLGGQQYELRTQPAAAARGSKGSHTISKVSVAQYEQRTEDAGHREENDIAAVIAATASASQQTTSDSSRADKPGVDHRVGIQGFNDADIIDVMYVYTSGEERASCLNNIHVFSLLLRYSLPHSLL